jgi:hypothetical protein
MAQPAPQAAAQPAPQSLGQAQLNELLAPIALYPDPLVAQILTASTYPLEVVEAARWSKDHPNVQGDALQNAMQQQPWDASVKGLTAVPQVLLMMNDKLDWMQQIGEAFLAQPDDVSNAIQQLRARAAANGNLKSSKELKVSRVTIAEAPLPLPPPPLGMDPAMLPPPPPPDYIEIEPADPDMFYTPIYDPMAVYGVWPWPAYVPFYWYPPGYVVGAAIFGFGTGYFVGPALWGHYDWAAHRVNIDVRRYNQFNRTNLAASGGFSNWQFNAAHRGNVAFRNPTLQQQFVNRSGTGQGNLNVNRNVNVIPNANINRNVNVNRNANINRNVVNPNANINRNVNVNRNANINRNVVNPNANINRNVNVNRNANINRNVVNPNANVNRNVSVNRNANINRNVVNPNANVNRNVNVKPNVNRAVGHAPASGGNTKDKKPKS